MSQSEKGIILQGQGVDHMMRDETVPRDIPLVRLVDPDMSDALSHWAILNALDFWRDGAHYRAAQALREWQPRAQRPATGARIGIMGIGAIGSVIATRFAALGFSVRGFARTERQLDGVEVFAGQDRLMAFADGLDIVVSVMPLTPDTTGIINADFIRRLNPGAFIINGGRGPQIDDDDLLAALDSGQVGGAALDVFDVEPLPQEHPYWTHPNVRVWPHVAAQTNADTAAEQVSAAINTDHGGKILPTGLTGHADIDDRLSLPPGLDIGKQGTKPHRLAALRPTSFAAKVPCHHVDMCPVGLATGKPPQE